MNIVRFADVDRDDQPNITVRKRRLPLGFADKTPRGLFGFGFYAPVIGQLDNAERKVPLTPAFTPGTDHCRHQQAVLLGPGCVRFALEPSRPFDIERHERFDHSVVDRRSDTVITQSVRHTRRWRRPRSRRFCLVLILTPFRDRGSVIDTDLFTFGLPDRCPVNGWL